MAGLLPCSAYCAFDLPIILFSFCLFHHLKALPFLRSPHPLPGPPSNTLYVNHLFTKTEPKGPPPPFGLSEVPATPECVVVAGRCIPSLIGSGKSNILQVPSDPLLSSFHARHCPSCPLFPPCSPAAVSRAASARGIAQNQNAQEDQALRPESTWWILVRDWDC
jgi:hypothetical protein